MARSLERVAACLDSGMPLPESLETSARLAPAVVAGPLAAIADDLRFGREPAPVGDVPGPWDSVVAATLGGGAAGARLSGQLRAIASELRSSRWDTSQELVRRTGVWAMLPLAGCFLPAFLLVSVVPLAVALLVGARP
jgi:hypothetical protein